MRQRVSGLVKSASRALQGDALLLQSAINKELQILLSMQYRAAAANGERKPFSEIGFNVYSETDEDGILLYIFSIIGMRTRTLVDIGAAGVQGSNTANLLTNHGYTGLLIDGNSEGVEVLRRHYGSHTYTKYAPPVCVDSMVTRDNINALISGSGFGGEIDLLCIDIDGNDYWIWDAVDAVDPAVVLIEYQDILGPDRAWTIPYRPDFDFSTYEVNREHRNYVGAGLRAMAKLADRKGYRLVGTNRGGWNAFFVKRGRGDEVLPEVSVESCFVSRWNQFGAQHRFPLVAEMEWVDVGG